MELSGIIFLVLALIGLSLFIYFLVKGFSSWGIWYTLMLVFVFLAAFTFAVATAGVASRRIAWIRVHDLLKAEAEKNRLEAELLKYGEMNRPSSDLNSLLPLVNEVSRLTVDRGRVWRTANLIDFKPDSVKLRMAAVQAPAPVPAAAANPAGGAAPLARTEVNGELPAELLVYAFGEGVGTDGRVVPRVYLGEYFVAESQGGNATLRPINPLLPQQIAAINAGQASNWTVYELMPLDSHEAFSAVGSKKANDAVFGRMDPQALADLLGVPLELYERYEADPSQVKDPKEVRQARLLRAYIRDGGRASETEAPENVWNRIEFLKEHVVEVDSKEQRNASDGGYFDSSGRTVDGRLKRAEGQGSITFRQGQQTIFAKKPADDLINQGVAKLIEPIFVRQINDYTIGFQETRIRIARATRDAEVVTREIAQVKATNAIGQEQIVMKQTERQLLDKDLAQYLKEKDVIDQEATRLDSAVKSVKSELSRLYRINKERYENLVRTQQELYKKAVNE